MTVIVIHPGAEKPFLGNGRWHVEYPEAHHFKGVAQARKTAQDILQATTSDEIKCKNGQKRINSIGIGKILARLFCQIRGKYDHTLCSIVHLRSCIHHLRHH